MPRPSLLLLSCCCVAMLSCEAGQPSNTAHPASEAVSQPATTSEPAEPATSHPSLSKIQISGEARIGFDEVEKICKDASSNLAKEAPSGTEFVYLGGRADSYIDEKGKPAACYTVYASMRVPGGVGGWKGVAYPLIHVQLKPVVEDGTIKVRARSGVSDLRIYEGPMLGGSQVAKILQYKVVEKIHASGAAVESRLAKLTELQGPLAGHVRSIEFDEAGITISAATDARGNVSAVWKDPTKAPNPADVKAEWNNGVKKENAVLIVTMHHDHLWFYRKTLGTSVNGGYGPLDRLIREDGESPGRHEIVMYCDENTTQSDLDRQHWHSTIRGKVDPLSWCDAARRISVRPGPNWKGHRLAAFEDKNWSGESAEYPVGDHGIPFGMTSFRVVK